jgi:tetratricopeptide (TPR) repeat protein
MPGKSYNKKGASGKCLSDDQLYRYLEKLLPKAESLGVQEHLDSCSVCFDDMVTLVRNAHTPASEAEKLEIARLRKLAPQEQVAKILEYVATEYPSPGPALNENARKALDDSSKVYTGKNFWPDLWQRVVSPRLLPRYAFAVATLLILAAASFWGIRYYQNAHSLAAVESELRANYRTYVNLRDYTASAPRLSGGYDHQPIMPMGGEEEGASYLENAQRRLEAVLVSDSKSVKAKHLLAQIFIVQEAYTRADSILREIPPASLQEAGWLNDQGALYLAMGNVPAAAQNFAAALQADPKSVEARYNLALIKARMGLTAEARTLLEEYLKLETNAGWRHAVESILERLQENNQ